MTLAKLTQLFIIGAVLTGCAATNALSGEKTDKSHAAHAHNKPTPYDAAADAKSDVETALTASTADGKMTIIAMGANWCHDSRAFAAQFEKERFASLLADDYRLLYVDVGKKDRNIDIARAFGVDSIVGTPTVFIVSPEGKVLNLDTAPTWRNAASRSEDEIFEYFEAYTQDGANSTDKAAPE